MSRRLLHFKSAFIKDGEIWCVPRVVNWIVKININDWSVKGICDLDLKEGSFIDYIFQQGDSIWCISSIGTKIVEYHIQTKIIRHYEIKSDKQRNRGALFFNGAFWILPIELPGNVICFDINKKKFMYHDNWKKECLKNKITGRVVSFCYDHNMVYMTLRDECRIICFNLENGKIKMKRLSGEFGLFSISKVNDDFFISSFKKRLIFRWNEKTGKIKKFYCSYLQEERYAKIVKFKDKILLMDERSRVDIFDINTGQIYPYSEFPKELKSDFKSNTFFPLFFDFLLYENRYFLIPWSANMLLEYVEEDKKWEGHMLKIPKEIFMEEHILKRIKKNHVIYEGYIKLDEFVSQIEISQNKFEDRFNKQVGNVIYHEIFMD